ncbi:receptor expression-enhancing protein 4 isoform X1 [Bos indicus x Bos taurus]|uniref:receptor expression-enhancing protein 4 isoform X1 n=1 Tax=Bos indicus x Bos taurus TaxID=30522 RepID=UPI000F7D2941|nr:receptor expression-enhancing protein 4 isoform X1 [Bos indicus x Bos taurus]
MGHFCRPEQAWGVCKQQGREVASRALTQAQVVQAKLEEQGRLVFGMLYPAYASYKAVKTKNIREYVRWMMYWIVFALFMAVETFTDIFISWFPFYYEIKMAFVLWLLSPYTRGASMLYRKFVHPSLSRHEKEIDTYIVQAKERSYETVLSFGKRGLNIAASAAVQAATKSQGALAGKLRSFSMQDLRTIPDGPAPTYQDPLYLEDQVPHRRPPIGEWAEGPETVPPRERNGFLPWGWRKAWLSLPPALRLCQCLALPPGSFSSTQGTGQGACETVTLIMSVGPTRKWSPSHQPGPERSRWAAARACV